MSDSVDFFLNLPKVCYFEPSQIIEFGQPSRLSRFKSVLWAVPFVGMPYDLAHPKWVQYTCLYFFLHLERIDDSRLSVIILMPNFLYLSCQVFVPNRRDGIGLATLRMPRCVVTSNVSCAVSKVQLQFMASLSGLNLVLCCPVLVSPIFIHPGCSPVALAVDTIRKLDCKAALKKHRMI